MHVCLACTHPQLLHVVHLKQIQSYVFRLISVCFFDLHNNVILYHGWLESTTGFVFLSIKTSWTKVN